MRKVQPDIKVGIALNMTNYRVDDENNEDLLELAGLMDSHLNRWWADAAVTGHYPSNLVESYGERLEKLIMPGDHELLKVQNDFLGINYYSDSFLGTPDDDTKPMIEGGLFPFKQRAKDTPPQPQTDMGWPITPEGLHDLVLRVSRDWPELGEIIITENGAAYPDGPDASGEIVDDRRVSYLSSHLEALGRAIEEGAPVTRYFAWSLMDNFEWAEGYDKRFGMIHVDFETLKRTPKKSAHVYATIIATNGESLKAVSV
jgi:beta-glucosidase